VTGSGVLEQQGVEGERSPMAKTLQKVMYLAVAAGLTVGCGSSDETVQGEATGGGPGG